MTLIVGVRFKDSSKTYFFDPLDLDLHQHDMVIVETARGPELATIAYGKREIAEADIAGDLKVVIRRAEKRDLESLRILQNKEEAALQRCAELVAVHELSMKLIKAEYSFDGSRLTFYFTAGQRVDFRMLVRDLAHAFKTRIELRQVGARDEARLLGGIGPCGRELCCATFLPDYATVNIKMVKDQDLPLNPAKNSGICGRLLCCLSYEHPHYIELRARLPHRGTVVRTPDGRGEVVAINALQQTVLVRLTKSGMEANYPLAQVQVPGEQHGSGAAPPYVPDDEGDDEDGHRDRRDRLDDRDVLEALALLTEGDTAEHSREQPGKREQTSQPSTKKRPAKRPRSRATAPSPQQKRGSTAASHQADQADPADAARSKSSSRRGTRRRSPPKAGESNQQPKSSSSASDTQKAPDTAASSEQQKSPRRARRKRQSSSS